MTLFTDRGAPPRPGPARDLKEHSWKKHFQFKKNKRPVDSLYLDHAEHNATIFRLKSHKKYWFGYFLNEKQAGEAEDSDGDSDAVTGHCIYGRPQV